MSFDELYLFDDEPDNDGSGSGSPGMCAFPFFSRNPLAVLVNPLLVSAAKGLAIVF